MSLPQFFPDCAVLEYISSWEGIRLTATRLPSDIIQIITSGTLFWGCMDNNIKFYWPLPNNQSFYRQITGERESCRLN